MTDTILFPVLLYRGFKIRERERIDSSPPPGMRQSWIEWQVVGPRGRVLARRDTLDQAKRWIDDQ